MRQAEADSPRCHALSARQPFHRSSSDASGIWPVHTPASHMPIRSVLAVTPSRYGCEHGAPCVSWSSRRCGRRGEGRELTSCKTADMNCHGRERSSDDSSIQVKEPVRVGSVRVCVELEVDKRRRCHASGDSGREDRREGAEVAGRKDDRVDVVEDVPVGEGQRVGRVDGSDTWDRSCRPGEAGTRDQSMR